MSYETRISRETPHSYEMRFINSMRQFMAKHPETDYNNLDGILKAISRITKASPDYLLSVALTDTQAQDYLLRVLSKLDNKKVA